MSEPIIEVINIQKSFRTGDRQELLVLNDINLKMYEGEIVAILGKSGSGKSTLLRIIAGLIDASSGQVNYRGKPIDGPARGVAMVFQTFALLPWLTVLLNEPFSALDVLTADNLKSDLMELWQSKKTGLNSILFVTHSIEEAIEIADRVIVFNSNPGSIRSDLRVTLPFPRSDLDPRFHNQVDRIYTLMTTQPQDEKLNDDVTKYMVIDIGYRLPEASISEVTGLLEILNSPEHQGRMDLPEVADSLMLNIDDLFPLTELLEILRYAKVSKGDITITEEGREFVEADILGRKKLFSVHLKKYVPLARYIYDMLERHPRHRALEENFLSLLEDYLSESESERVLSTVIEWGRYAELFAYDYNSGVLSLENPR